MNSEILGKKNGFLLRAAQKEDAQKYFRQNYDPLDGQVARLTGCNPHFSEDEVIRFFYNALADPDRYDFLIVTEEGNIIGESVINEIDWELRKANFRIAIFHSNICSKGIGSWAIEKTVDFAFENLHLHRLELDVFSFNKRAQKAYLKAGFKIEGVLKDAVKDGDQYADDILMAILEEDWKALKTKKNELI